MKTISRWWLLLRRWLHRAAGGCHATEHAEVLHSALVIAERETAVLRLEVLHLADRHRMLVRGMLTDELMSKLEPKL